MIPCILWNTHVDWTHQNVLLFRLLRCIILSPLLFTCSHLHLIFHLSIFYLSPLANTFHNGRSENSYTSSHRHPVILYLWQGFFRQCKHTFMDSYHLQPVWCLWLEFKYTEVLHLNVLGLHYIPCVYFLCDYMGLKQQLKSIQIWDSVNI